MTVTRVCLVALALVAAARPRPPASRSAASRPMASRPAASRSAFEPTENYVVQDIEGWKIYVHKRLLGDKKDLWTRTLKVVTAHLVDINRMIPRPALDRLHEIPIWIEAESANVRCMCYHPSWQWLREHGFNPDKAGAVELGNPETFLSWTTHQRAMVLHELAHGYHHHVAGYDNPDIRAAYERAKESGSYESVLHFDGVKRRAYAMNNDQEYFAELTEAYFGTNDIYPFVRAELIQHDPQGAEMIRKVWTRPPASRPAIPRTPASATAKP